MEAFDLAGWMSNSSNLAALKPPVGNMLLYGNEFKVMLVAGPNVRNDYHVEAGEELFYQLKGDMVLKVVEGAASGEGSADVVFRDIHIREGSTFCLPAGVPHSPQRLPDSLGLVVERDRRAGEVDLMRWYCDQPQCKAMLYEEAFVCHDLVKDLPPIIAGYRADEAKRTCKKCGSVDTFGLR
ncbi:3-hydroxyanthranilate 3,4-dioxygenase [Porphyridium purpureum]|uniref:3-hydroxyanthranilate 3,4-dioxygenase n=1 Tax=Porphyridium purpureum TaxID=35688 RepID=A0A5J4Z7A3_PORPP|nr:3-hydroxyanthranilate 3,4-dioxygenase [Porphyridium purpureum]|eukprot:POR7257..scf295_1